MCPPQSVFIFLLKISPPDQTLRPACKFLILGIFYHAKKNGGKDQLLHQDFRQGRQKVESLEAYPYFFLPIFVES